MKALFLNGYFRLPDDFSGNLSDSLELLAQYLRTASITKREHTEEESKEFDAAQDILYPQFIDAVLNRGKRFKAIHGLFETDEKGNFIKEFGNEV